MNEFKNFICNYKDLILEYLYKFLFEFLLTVRGITILFALAFLGAALYAFSKLNTKIAGFILLIISIILFIIAFLF